LVDSGAFQSLAEFGIALAGFTSIIVVFSRRDGQFHPADRFRILSALVPSLGASFLALVPVGLDLTGLSPSAVWRVSSLVLVVAVAADSLQGEIQLRRLSAEARAILSSRLTSFLRALRLFALLAGLLNATGILFAPQSGVYFFAVLCPLLFGAVVFVRMVFVRPAV
jgi:hypothetical protein